MRHGPLRLPRHAGRIRLGPSLQKFRRRKVEIERPSHFDVLPRVSNLSLLVSNESNYQTYALAMM